MEEMTKQMMKHLVAILEKLEAKMMAIMAAKCKEMKACPEKREAIPEETEITEKHQEDQMKRPQCR
jgi:hypothetical protein